MTTASMIFAPLILAQIVTVQAPAPADADVTKPPAYDQFVVIPLRFHILTSKDLPMADCTLTEADATKAVAEINRIWEKAGIRFAPEPIVREPAAQVARFNEYVKITNGEFSTIEPFVYLLPASSRGFDGLRVVLFRDLPINGGNILGADAVIVRQEPQLRAVAGGGDVPVARVAARGLGQALGLEARQADEVGLMSSGTNGVALGEAEVARARTFARTIPGALDVPAATKLAEAATAKGDTPTARRLWTALSKIPGTGAEAARKKLEALAPAKP